MNQKCQTIGHNQRQIEFICIQPKEILWGCSKCYEQYKNKYSFKPIIQIQKVLNQSIQEINNNNCLKLINIFQTQFNEALQQAANTFNQSINYLKQSFEIQYKEVLDFLTYLNGFSFDNLDSFSQENSKYLFIVVNQKASLYTKLEVQASFTIEKIKKIHQEIKKNMNEVFDSRFKQILDDLNYKYEIQNEFKQQIINLQIPNEYRVNNHPQLSYCQNYKLEQGVSYSGQLCNNQLQGIGVLEIENQNIIYYGAFIEGHFTYGIKCKLEQNQLFQGNFQQNNKYDYYIDQNGIMIKANIERYDGSFLNELQEGEGISHYKNKDSYCGGWKKGKYDGQGCLIKLKGSLRMVNQMDMLFFKMHK
ncbi:unnamed protein product [Paramecium primaurelia]|uniref:MORN repeat protein n=1 Tax=Paramecium primaurelia TaxID=5886 RepID=A0A8S1QHH0_PARPR|nr:unnamed protein product [Paramecium primaurelia]